MPEVNQLPFRLLLGDVMTRLRELPSASVQCVVTSPPYWGLRDYGTAQWQGGDPKCKHDSGKVEKRSADDATPANIGVDGAFQRVPERAGGENSIHFGNTCKLCGATRIDHQLGSEDRPDCGQLEEVEEGIFIRGNCAERDWTTACHVCRMVLVFREVRRVLRDDGTLWLNYGDTYAGSKGNTMGPGVGGNNGGKNEQLRREYDEAGEKRRQKRKRKNDTHRSGPVHHEGYKSPFRGTSTDGSPYLEQGEMTGGSSGLPAGNLVGVPWRVALALQADGWILRQDIVWCLSGGTWLYVQTQKGEMPMMLRDAARLDPSTVKLWNGDRWTQVLGWSRTSRNADELELVLRSGERIGCTPSHQFPTERGLLQAGEIRVGDVLGIVELPQPEEPHAPPAVPLDAAWFIGLYLAEGSKSVNTDGSTHILSIAGHTKEVERWERVKRVADWYGGSATLTVSGNNQTIRVYGQMLFALIEDHLSGRVAKDKALKVRCWSYSNDWLLELLLGYLSGDGHWDAKNNSWRLGFCRNYNWERDLRVLAARIGFRLVLIPTYADGSVGRFPAFRGEIRFTQPTGHWNEKNVAEVVEIRKSRCREVYDVGVYDEPNVFTLSSGILTHNSKPSPMPESVTNRCTKSHEYVFLLTKRQQYFCDMEAIREPSNPSYFSRYNSAFNAGPKIPSGQGRPEGKKSNTPGMRPVIQDRNKRSVWSQEDHTALLEWLAVNNPEALKQFMEEQRDKKDVWTVASQGFPGAHFASFPVNLITPMILAGTSAKGCCGKCGVPWRRVVEKVPLKRDRPNEFVKRSGQHGTGNSCPNTVAGVETLLKGWEPTCTCHGKFEKRRVKVVQWGGWQDSHPEDMNVHNKGFTGYDGADPKEVEKEVNIYIPSIPLKDHPIKPCVVLDPFGGAMTTGLVSVDHGRKFIGIELNPKYLAMGKMRILDAMGVPRDLGPPPDTR